MSILNATLASTPGASDTVLGLSKELEIDPAHAEKAIMVLARSYTDAGDTMALASAKTGMDKGALEGIVGKLGGNEGLNALSETLSQNGRSLGRGSFLDGLFG